MDEIRAQMNATGKRFAIVASRWNEFVTKELVAGAVDTLEAHQAGEIVVVHVPGTWEMPLAVRASIEKYKPHAVLALGCVLQGATSHAQQLAGEVGGALMRIQLEAGVPIAWGILTPETQEQAIERAGMKLGNKGREAAVAAIEMAILLERLA
jgi:6,7-dimethyl-8-ribityllumazine synthase